MSQPDWEYVANLGDKDFIEHGGLFVFIDKTGIYPPEMELLTPPEEGEKRWEVRRAILEKCTFIDGILSDNQFHPEHPAWFAQPESKRAERPQDTTYLANVARSAGQPEQDFIDALCGDDVVVRAFAYKAIADYHGWENFDDYPNTYTRKQVVARYKGIEG